MINCCVEEGTDLTRNAPIQSDTEPRGSTMTAPQRSTGPDSRCWIWTPQPAVAAALQADQLVRIEAVAFRSGSWPRVTREAIKCFLPSFEPFHFAADSDGQQLRVLPRCINPRNVP